MTAGPRAAFIGKPRARRQVCLRLIGAAGLACVAPSLLADGKLTEQPTMQSFEFHFQEGFTGQVVEIVSDGRVLERLTLRTRFQIGLADIARAELAPGDRVTLRMREPPLETHVVLDAATPYLAVTFTGESLLVTATAGTPGYV